MTDGMYHLRFSCQGRDGEGLALFQNGKVNGGDRGFLYLGSFSQSGNSVSAKLKLKQWNPGVQSVLGAVREADLDLTGKADDKSFEVSGSVAQARIKILGHRISDAA